MKGYTVRVGTKIKFRKTGEIKTVVRQETKGNCLTEYFDDGSKMYFGPLSWMIQDGDAEVLNTKIG